MVSCLSLSDEGHSSSTTPHASPVTCKSHDSSSHGTLDNKENILLSHTNISGSKEVTPTNQTETSRTPLGSVCESQFEGSLVVFPSKVGMKMTPQTANTRRLLKEQELQLKALQEQARDSDLQVHLVHTEIGHSLIDNIRLCMQFEPCILLTPRSRLQCCHSIWVHCPPYRH